MYIFEEYHYNQLAQIKGDWERLQKGHDMTIYQSYDWYHMLQSYSLRDSFLHINSFAVCRNEKKEAIIIAPLWILRYSLWWPFNRKGFYFLGREASSDYLNMIYKDFNPEALDFLLQQLSKKYNLHTFKFELVREDSALYNYLLKKNIIRDHRLISVALHLPDSEDEYKKMLSKSSKQNLRTANNRLQKDEKTILFKLDDSIVNKDNCLKIKNSRLEKKSYEPDLKRRIKKWLFKKLSIQFPKYVPFLTDAETYIMSAYCEGNLAAFFNYAIDYNSKSVIILTAGTNEDYARYSPGMLLMFEFIKHTISNDNDIKVIDFTRGNEHYKYALGGENNILHSIRFIIAD